MSLPKDRPLPASTREAEQRCRHPAPLSTVMSTSCSTSHRHVDIPFPHSYLCLEVREVVAQAASPPDGRVLGPELPRGLEQLGDALLLEDTSPDQLEGHDRRALLLQPLAAWGHGPCGRTSSSPSSSYGLLRMEWTRRLAIGRRPRHRFPPVASPLPTPLPGEMPPTSA